MRQSINSFLLLDKSVGISSNQAVQKVKEIFGAKKAGHTGCLDVLASGMLPICLNEATKFSDYLMQANKTYDVKAKLGERTNTFDGEGEVIDRKSVPDLIPEKLQCLLNENFKGDIEQIPPMFSAIKHKGKPLYKLAREGIEIERKSRRIHIYAIDVLAVQSPFVNIRVYCSKGTYVRSLMDDIGQRLGCGAHVVELRRISIESLPERMMISLDELNEDSRKKQNALLPIDVALSHLPARQLSRLQTKEIQFGRKLYTSDSPVEAIRLYDDFKQFIGLGQITEDGKLSAKRLLKL